MKGILAIALTGLFFTCLGQSNYIERTSPNPASAQLFFFDRTSNGVTDRNWKIATLPASTTSTGDKIMIELFGGSHGSTSTFQQIIHMGNRNSFNGYTRTSFGEPYSSVRIRAYQNSNGSVDVYFSLLANGWKGGSVRVYEGSGIVGTRPSIYENPIDVGTTPSGTLVFDSYTEVPGIVSRNDGNLGLGTNSPFSGTANKGLHIAKGPHSSLLLGDPKNGFGGIVQTSDGRQRVFIGANLYDDENSSWSSFTPGKGSAGISIIADEGSWGTSIDFITSSSDAHYNRSMKILGNGYVGIGTMTPDMKLTVQGSMNVGGSANGMVKTRHVNGKNHTNSDYGNLYLNYHTTHPVIVGTSTKLAPLLVYGKVGIGTTSPSEKLEVNGTIRSKEVKVEIDGWPDYVFEEDYDLRSLEETEAYIKANKHLPEIPSAKEIEENGVRLGEMNRLLLKKIEELTLHQIEMMKIIKEQQKEIKLLKSK